MRALFVCLERFGFEARGLNQSDPASLTLCYPARPAVMAALKAFAAPRICRVSFGFDFTKFNYRVFAHAIGAKLPLEDLYSYRLLSCAHQDFLSRLNRALGEAGADYGECAGGWYHGTQPCQYRYKNKVRILQNMENGLMPAVVVRFGQKAEKMARFIESLPAAYHGSIQKCRGCQKGACDHRVPVTAAGKKYTICNIAWWGFPPEPEAIPYIVGAYKI
jgi:hypothetical protein